MNTQVNLITHGQQHDASLRTLIVVENLSYPLLGICFFLFLSGTGAKAEHKRPPWMEMK